MKKFICILLFLFPVVGFAQWEIIDTAAKIDYSLGYDDYKYFCLIDDGSFAYYYTVSYPDPSSPNQIESYKTNNNGKTWTNIIGMGDYSDFAYQMCFPNRDTGYFTYNNAELTIMQKTTNGGLTWSILNYDGLSDMYFINGSKGYGFRGNVLIRYDHDSMITVDTLNLIKQYPMQLCFTKNHIGYLICSNYPATQSTIMRTFDDGQNWISSLHDSTATFTDLCAPSDSVCYVSCNNGKVYKTIDAGNSWIKIDLGTSNSINSISFIKPDTGFVLADYGKVFKTLDGGALWKMNQIPEDLSGSLIKMITDSVAYIQASGSHNQYGYYIILKTTTGGVEISEKPHPSKLIKIFPTPSSTFVTIETTQIPATGQLSIMNLNGQELMTRQITSPKTQIDISNLPNGVYFVRLTNDKTVEVGKFVKQ
jgi:photosystem II stability/assembly factor-like uncharacterized protein